MLYSCKVIIIISTINTYSILKCFRKKSVFELLQGYKVKAAFEVDDICASFKIPKCETFSFGLVSGQSSVEHYIHMKGNYLLYLLM